MATFTRPLDLYKHQKARFERMGQDMKRGHEDIAREGEKDLLKITSGAISTKQLRAMGHPFGKGLTSSASTPAGLMRGNRNKKINQGRRSVPLLPVNKQTGKLHGSVFMQRSYAATQTFIVGASESYASYVLSPFGTPHMVARGVYSGRDVGRKTGPAGYLELKYRARNKAFLDVFVRNQRKP